MRFSHNLCSAAQVCVYVRVCACVLCVCICATSECTRSISSIRDGCVRGGGKQLCGNALAQFAGRRNITCTRCVCVKRRKGGGGLRGRARACAVYMRVLSHALAVKENTLSISQSDSSSSLRQQVGIGPKKPLWTYIHNVSIHIYIYMNIFM